MAGLYFSPTHICTYTHCVHIHREGQAWRSSHSLGMARLCGLWEKPWTLIPRTPKINNQVISKLDGNPAASAVTFEGHLHAARNPQTAVTCDWLHVLHVPLLCGSFFPPAFVSLLTSLPPAEPEPWKRSLFIESLCLSLLPSLLFLFFPFLTSLPPLNTSAGVMSRSTPALVSLVHLSCTAAQPSLCFSLGPQSSLFASFALCLPLWREGVRADDITELSDPRPCHPQG